LFYICFLQKLRGEPVQLSKPSSAGFDHFVQSLVATLVTMGPASGHFPRGDDRHRAHLFGVFSMAEMQDASGCLVLGGSIARSIL